MRGIEDLRAALEALPFGLDDVSVQFAQAAVASYPGGFRPSSVVTLIGGGLRGLGEHVGWTNEEHASFRDNIASCKAALTSRRGASSAPAEHLSLGEWIATLSALPAYDRAALEAAAIDLALQQQGSNLFAMAGVAPAPVRYVVSFARVEDPVAEVTSQEPGDIELKIDADSAWPDSVYRRLAQIGRVAVLDFKLQGAAADYERACCLLPDAWIEDPKPDESAWSPSLLARWSADAVVSTAAAMETLVPRPAAINVKPARMGSVLDAITCLARCRALGISTYIGGMFEIGVGRSQLRVLAALACPDGPNDIAPLDAERRRPPRLFVHGDEPGFSAGDPP